MTYTNEKKLLCLLAQAHVGDTAFEKKYGLEIYCIIAKDGHEPTAEELSEFNERYAEQFADQVAQKLATGEVTTDFLYDLLFNAPSVPGREK